MKIKNSGIAAYLNTAKVRALSLLLVVICLLAGCVNGDPTGGTSSSGKEDSTSSESKANWIILLKIKK